MKRVALLALLGMAIATLSVTQPSVATEAAAKAKGKAASVRYLVIAPHTAEQCAKALDDASAAGSLGKWDFGCMDGDHTGYLMVMASSSEEALMKVPTDERSGARAIKLHHFTAAELKGIHEHMADSK